MKKDILFLCQYFYPENNSSATLPFDTARYLVQAGFCVDALVGYPKEYCQNEHIPIRETVDGVGIRRIRYLQLRRAKKLGRLINYFSFIVSALCHCARLRKYHSVIVYSNPPVLPLVAAVANALFGTKIIFVAYDVYPEIAYASNSVKPGSILDKVMQWVNHSVYKRISAVIALTDEMKAFLLQNRPGLTEDKVITIANWAHEGKTQANTTAYDVFGYTKDQFIVSYFGNMGVCQDMETLLGAAETLADRSDIQFLLVGHGVKLENISRRIAEKKLRNVTLLPFLTGEKFQQAVAISACCVVTLEKGLKGMCAPSKYYSYLQGGKPVLAVTDEGSYLQSEIEKEQLGYAVTVGQVQELADVICRMKQNPDDCRNMGIRVQEHYEREYAKKVGLAKYQDVFTKLLPKDATNG
jgi:glycosyltransferase involved in cell wall biosynthesis